MGYLICNKCGGYYELQPGEKPEDFSNECECGGELIYSDNLDVTGENGDIYSLSYDVTGENSEDENTLNEEEILINNKGKSNEDYRDSFKDKSLIKQMKLATEVQEILETKGYYIIKGNRPIKSIKLLKDGIETDEGQFIKYENIISIEGIEDVTHKPKISSEKSGIGALISAGYQIIAPNNMTLKIISNKGEIELKNVKRSNAKRCVSFVKRRLNKVNS